MEVFTYIAYVGRYYCSGRFIKDQQKKNAKLKQLYYKDMEKKKKEKEYEEVTAHTTKKL